MADSPPTESAYRLDPSSDSIERRRFSPSSGALSSNLLPPPISSTEPSPPLVEGRRATSTSTPGPSAEDSVGGRVFSLIVELSSPLMVRS
ncbi:hypothetical protein KIH74_35535, partial [Kineosporia sp. J2-2]